MRESTAPVVTHAIPFNRARFSNREVEYVLRAMDAGHAQGDGEFTRACHALLESELGVHKTLLTTSCTHALEMCALLLDIRPGDEVILPSFTFVSTANAFVLRGAIPVFADIRRDTLNLDETQLERLITPRTRAIVVLHYGGVGCEMDAILALAERRGLTVVEDNAHGLFGRYRGRHLGTLGSLAAHSFHGTKNLTCGEGGALFINAPQYAERAEILREKGTNRSRFFRGQVDKYTWVDIGSSYLPAEIVAACLLGQLERREEIYAERRRIWEHYDRHLRRWAEQNDIQQPTIPPHCDQAYHLYYILLPSLACRQALIAHMNSRHIQTAFHYLPLHLSDMGQQFGGQPGDCPVTEDISDRLLRLPLWNGLTDGDLDHVAAALQEFSLPGE